MPCYFQVVEWHACFCIFICTEKQSEPLVGVKIYKEETNGVTPPLFEI